MSLHEEVCRAGQHRAGNCLILCGLAAIAAGAGLCHPAAGLIVGGLACLLLAVLMRPPPSEPE